MEISFNNLSDHLLKAGEKLASLDSSTTRDEVFIMLQQAIKICLDQLAHSYSITRSDNLIDLFESIKAKYPKPTNSQEFTKTDQGLKRLSEIVPIDFKHHKNEHIIQTTLSISSDDIVLLNETAHSLWLMALRREDEINGVLRPGL